MTHFVDRRLNPKGRSLGNRRRFIRRVRNHVKQAVDRAVRERSIADAGRAERVTVPADGILEPTFHHAAEGGHRERVLPGNKTFCAGDRIKKPPRGASGAGRRGSPGGDGEDDFAFILSREEFLDLFFDDLELPDLIKRSLKAAAVSRPRRAGQSVTGSPANLNVPRTMQNALGRRLALRRPNAGRIDELRARIAFLEAQRQRDEAAEGELAGVRAELDQALRRRQLVPYLDPLDVRYTYFEQQPEPSASAVMFCLMDVSASMREREKDLAKRFFILLHLFLTRRYDRVELVFIRHTHLASEVDEETFFHSPETGGTVVSSALIEMHKIIAERYATDAWNIYVAQASDGDNYSGDSRACADMLCNEVLKLCQYFAYVEIIDEQEARFLKSDATGTELWTAYRAAAAGCPNLAMKRIAKPSDIYPVFRELFARKAADPLHA